MSVADANFPTIQWQVDNLREFEEFLEPFHTRMKREGDSLLLQGHGGMNITLDPGDCLLLDGESLGVVRAATAQELALPV